ncbi:CPBP family intramembrane metalloprotease [Geodermatophilus sp. YIM 151500]|uniref:type II CAAX endopeptidase family protein n=1 Tax=Geodermatophilus sp. YIM 151500 TaxID=2984531 RepID=UPI0021E4EDA9|nr:type II CAAX endopeptidase family protein [Geodermatophilus sp. YIM 151500]MCV2489660.1 CPBP family intramembrane metalloprotease [Geodermatophilus sp. YIM 151500]
MVPPATAGGPTAATAGRGLRAFTLRRPLTAFLLLALPAGWVLLAVPALAFHGVLPGGRLPAEPFALAMTLLVMLPAALWVVSVTEGRAGVRALLARTFRWRFGLGGWAAVLLALPVTTVAVGAALGRGVRTADLPSVLATELLGLVVAVVVINLWEETVWAGFVQTRLERRHGLVAGAVLTALPFAAGHLPLAFAEDVTPSSLLTALAYLLVAALLFRLLVGVVLRGAAGSVLAVAVLHASWNTSSGSGGLADDLLSGGQPVTSALVAVALVTLCVALVVRPRLRPGAREEVPAGPAGAGGTGRPLRET